MKYVYKTVANYYKLTNKDREMRIQGRKKNMSTIK